MIGVLAIGGYVAYKLLPGLLSKPVPQDTTGVAQMVAQDVSAPVQPVALDTDAADYDLVGEQSFDADQDMAETFADRGLTDVWAIAAANSLGGS